MHAKSDKSQIVLTTALTAALALLSAVTIAVLYLTPLPDTSIWWQEAQNASHFVLFFAFAIVAGFVASRVLPLASANPAHVYRLVFLFACALAIATELMQAGTAREASAADFLRDAAGALAGLLFLAAIDKAMHWRKRTRAMAILAAVLVTVAAGHSLLRWTAAYAKRQHDFPQLTSFKSSWAAPFIEMTDSDLAALPADLPEDLSADLQEDTAEAATGYLTVLQIRQGRWPGFTHLEPSPDWTGYATFAVNIYNPSDLVHNVTLRVHDRSHSGEFEDRFNRDIRLVPGRNEVRIALVDIARAPAGRQIDLDQIANFSLFAVQPAQPFELYLSNFFLLEQNASLITSVRHGSSEAFR